MLDTTNPRKISSRRVKPLECPSALRGRLNVVARKINGLLEPTGRGSSPAALRQRLLVL